MNPEKEYLQSKFDEYNRLYFGGKLKKTKLGVLSEKYKTIVGMFEFEIDDNRRVKNTSIKINKRVIGDEEKLRRILLHEMAHLSVTQKYKKDKKHGIAYIKECKRIESQYNVTVWHCWMKRGYISKGTNILSAPIILCRDFVSLIKFRIVQKLVYLR